VSVARADEAVRRDGSRVSGQLTLSTDGRFAFRVADRVEPIAELEFVRFRIKPPAVPAVPLWHQLRFAHGEVLLAEVRKLDAAHLIVRPTWADSLSVPRTAIERVTQAPGGRLVFLDTFDGELSAWTKVGAPGVEASCLLLTAGQSVETQLKSAVAAGRVAVTFRSAVTKSRTLALELGFERDGKLAPVRIELVGPGERYSTASPTKPHHDGRLKRTSGTRRLAAEFDADRLHLFLDDLVLWSQETGPGALRSIHLLAGGDGSEPATVDDIQLSRSERPTEPKPWADLTADAIRSPDSDETFGSVLSAGPAGLSFEARGRKFAVAWPDIAEFAFRRGPVPERRTAGEHVRVRIRSADGVRDILDGAVRSFDDNALVLAHAVLGDLTIPRDRVEELRLLFHGRRLPLDTTPVHLGTWPAFGFAVPKPDALRFIELIKVEPAPASGFVLIDAAHVNRTGTPIEVLVNGERIGELNQLADRAEPVVRAYRLPLPAQTGADFKIEVRLRPDDSGKRVTSVDVRALRLELHDRR